MSDLSKRVLICPRGRGLEENFVEKTNEKSNQQESFELLLLLQQNPEKKISELSCLQSRTRVGEKMPYQIRLFSTPLFSYKSPLLFLNQTMLSLLCPQVGVVSFPRKASNPSRESEREREIMLLKEMTFLRCSSRWCML